MFGLALAQTKEREWSSVKRAYPAVMWSQVRFPFGLSDETLNSFMEILEGEPQ